MKSKLYFLYIFLAIFASQNLFAERDYKIMPIGNSITYGIVNGQIVAGKAGYRKYLEEKLNSDANINDTFTFVGDDAGQDATVPGWFIDGARVDEFYVNDASDDSAYGHIVDELAQHYPNIVLLHIGTNDIGSDRILGDYITPNTIMNDLYLLVNAIVQDDSVQNLFLCKVIPKLNTLSNEAATKEYNNALQVMLDESGLDNVNNRNGDPKIELVDMHTPFEANQDDWYSPDWIHPNDNGDDGGYNQMAKIFYQYLRPYFLDQLSDDFNRAGTAVGGNWNVSNYIQLVNLDGVGNSDAMHMSGSATPELDDWDNLAVWSESENFANIQVQIHDSSNVDQLWAFGICVGLSSADTSASGYMVFQHPTNNRFYLYRVVNGAAVAEEDQASGPELQPGDVIDVLYTQGTGTSPNNVTLNINDNTVNLTDDNPVVGNTDPFYSGILFNGRGASEIYIDKFTVKSQKPDIVAPDPPYNVSVVESEITNTTVLLSWQAPGNDGLVKGPASAYDLRYSTSEIENDEDFIDAKIVTGMDQPGEPGTVEEFRVTGLIPDTKYYFALKALDSWGNVSELSTVVSARTSLSNFVEVTFDYPRIVGNDTIDFEDEWYANSTQYGINASDELQRTSTGSGWGNPVIYTKRLNASIVKLIWGSGVTDLGSGHGGLALMMNTPSATASGYLLWIHYETNYQTPYVRLYDVVGGAPTEQIDYTPYILDDMPGTGDTLTVALNWEDLNGIKFDVFVNGENATQTSIFDSDSRHNPSNKYSGIMLRGADSGTNNVHSLIVSSEPDKPSAIVPYSWPTTATVSSTPAEKVKIQILDSSNSPAEGVPVWFDVVSPADASILDEENVQLFDPVHIEAEWNINFDSGYRNTADEDASNGAYMVSSTDNAYLSYIFHVKTQKTYYFWVRSYTTGYSNMTYIVQVDDKTAWVSDSYQAGDTPGWMWKAVNNKPVTGFTPVSMSLKPGAHTLVLKKVHDNVPIDKIVITSDEFSGSWIESAEVDPMMTDTDGFAEVSVTIGEDIGSNVFKAYALGITDPATITIEGIPASPDTIIKTIGTNNQTGSARDTSDIPLEVTIKDAFGNPNEGVTVKFKSVKGDCKLLTPQVQTDADGKASTVFVFGEQDSIHHITASLPQYPLVPADTFTVYTGSGRVHDVVPKKGKYSGEKHYVSMVLDSFLVAQIVNEKDEGVNNTPVTFRVVQGDAQVGNQQPKYTQRVRGKDGIVSDTLFIGSMSSVIKVIADAGLAKDTIVIDSSYYRATLMRYIQGNNSRVKVGSFLDDKIKVRVYNNPDIYNLEYAKNFPVQFRITDSRYGFKFANGKQTITAYTDNNGTATIDVYPSNIHGIYNDIIEVSATDGFNPIETDDFDGTFTIIVTSNAQALEIISGDNAEGVILSEIEDSLKVRMVYYDVVTGQPIPVANQPVTFTRLSSNGHFTGYTYATAELDVLTDDDGYAWLQYTLGSKAGIHSDSVMVSATNGENELYNSPHIYKLSARSTEADSIAPYSNIELKGTAGRPLSGKVEAQVLDHFGNGVPDESVVFRVIKGGGSLEGTTDTVKTVVSKGAGGIAGVSWTLGTKAGHLNNKMEAIATNGIDSLSGSPVYFWATVEADSVSEIRSIIETDTTRYKANGIDTCWVIITLMDKYGNPVQGKMVEISIDGTTHNFKHDPTVPTDSLGKTLGYFQSITSGEKTIRAKDKTDNLTLDDQAKVLFESDVATKIARVSIERPAGNVGTVLKDPLVVKVLDSNNNPVPNKSVTFSAADGATVIESQPVLSDSLGEAKTHVLLSQDADQVIIEVSSASLIGDKVYFFVQGKDSEPVYMGYTDDDERVEGPAGQILDEPFKVQIQDADYDPVAGVDVEFSIIRGNGEIISVHPSDKYGQAKAYFKMGSVVDGSYSEIRASANLAGSPLHFFATPVAGEADRIMAVSDTQQDKQVDETTVVIVKVVDEFGNPVQYVDVKFEVVKGGAYVVGNKIVQSDKYGEASGTINVGHAAGTVEVLAINATLKDSPVKFYIDVSTSSSMADHIRIYPVPENADTVYVGALSSYLPDSLYVQVVDQYNNPVSGVVVRFEVESGPGQIAGSNFWVGSKENGTAAAQFLCGSSAAQSVVKASWQPGKNTVRFKIQSVNNPRYPVLKKGPPYYEKVVNIDEMDQADYLQIALVGDNRDPGETLTFQAFDANSFYPNQPPAGMVIQKQSVNTANLEWVPNYTQAGEYKLVLRVLDGQGGYDTDTVQVNVANTDLPPVIYDHFVPDPNIVAGMTQHFWIDVRDPDGDPITYLWYVDDKKVESTTSDYEHTFNDRFAGTQVITVYARAGIPSVSYKWEIDVHTFVKMTSMLAQFDKFQREVVLSWQTSHEFNNLGFDVYRSYNEFGNYKKINKERIVNSEDGSYSFIDNNVKAGVLYYYKIVDHDRDGESHDHGPITMAIPVPNEFILSQNFPNPFNPSTRIQYELPSKDHVRLNVYNMLGQRVTTLVNDVQDAGYYDVIWDGRNAAGQEVATGIYLFRLQSNKNCMTKRMVKLK